MAVSKKQSNKKTSTRKGNAKRNTRANSKTSTAKKNQAAKESLVNSFQTDIILLVILAAAIILMFSNFGMGGFVGTAISNVSFGLFGLLAYIFPIGLFLGVAFLISNKSNPLAYKKFFAAVIFFVFMCGFVHLITEGYVKSSTLKDYYALCADYRTGGGILGGAICMSTAAAFGVGGSYVIIILVLIITMILTTQRSFFGFLTKIWDGIILKTVQGGRERYAEGQPERDMKREIRQQERRIRKAERIRELEEELEEGRILLEAEPFMANSLIAPPKEKSNAESANEAVDVTEYVETKAVKTRKRRKKAEEDIETQLEEALDMDDLKIESTLSSRGQMMFKIHRAEPVEELEDTFVEETDVEKSEELFVEDSVQEIPAKESEYVTGAITATDSMLDAYADADFTQEKLECVKETESTANEKKISKNPKSSKEEIEDGIVNIKHEIDDKEAQIKKEYVFPPLNLLKKGNGNKQGDSDEYLRKTAMKLQETLANFGVDVTVTNVSCGPTVTRYELQPKMGVKVSKIVALADDIKLNLAVTDLRIEAPIPGKAAVGIEVPNKENSAVMLRDLLASKEFQNSPSKLTFAVGKDIAGGTVVTDIAKMPHLLIAGSTGSGKSVCINTLIISILYKSNPDEVKLIMIDPKVVELSVYNGIPHLLIPVVTEPKKAAGALNWAVSEMTTRYNTFAEYGVRNIGEYNKKIEAMTFPEGEIRPDKMPQIIVIVDELADLMMVAPGEVEDAICRLAQLARAAGIHLIIATQRPSVNVITGLIKANMPSRIAFAVSSGVDSRTILDSVGAEKLLGKGDMLFYPQGYPNPVRLQGSFVSDEEVSRVVEYVSDKNPGMTYNTQIEQHVNTMPLPGSGASGDNERDTYFEEAGKFIIDKEKASIGMLQRMFKIGFNRAARIMDQLCDAGVVGPEEGTKPRKVLMTMDEFQTYLEEYL